MKKERIAALQSVLKKAGVTAFLVSNPVNIRYLLGKTTLFDSNFNGALLLLPTEILLFTDFRYILQAQRANLGVPVIQGKNYFHEEISTSLQEAKVERIGVESTSLTVKCFHSLKSKLKAKVVPLEDLVEKIRTLKDEKEVSLLAQAAGIADSIFPQVLELLKPGVSEIDIALEIDFMLRRAGAEKPSFEIVIASGPNSAIPHFQASKRTLQKGDFVKMDFGAVYQGYHSDMTRTVVLGKASAEQRRIYSLVAEAQKLAFQCLKPGISGAEADAVAREFFRQAELAEKFGHNLGHGVGLDIHELPVLGSKYEQPLEPGMVFTVEPGLYLPELGGVRIEDMVHLKSDGIEILTKTPKDLVEL